MRKWIDFDLVAVRHLKECYEATMQDLLEQLPDLNWDSRLEVKDYFGKEHGLVLQFLQIGYLKQVLDDPEAYLELFGVALGAPSRYRQLKEELGTFIEYLKLKYLVRNYLDCILRHSNSEIFDLIARAAAIIRHEEASSIGRVYLREVNGAWLMPNKQPLPAAQELKECIVGEGEEP